MFSILFVELTNIYVHIATNNLKRIYMKSLLIIGAGPMAAMNAHCELLNRDWMYMW